MLILLIKLHKSCCDNKQIRLQLLLDYSLLQKVAFTLGINYFSSWFDFQEPEVMFKSIACLWLKNSAWISCDGMCTFKLESINFTSKCSLCSSNGEKKTPSQMLTFRNKILKMDIMKSSHYKQFCQL